MKSLVLAAGILVSGGTTDVSAREDWIKCQNYDGTAEHVAQCLSSFPQEVEATQGACPEVRKLYEDKLLTGNGQLPDDYQPARCGTVKDAMKLLGG